MGKRRKNCSSDCDESHSLSKSIFLVSIQEVQREGERFLDSKIHGIVAFSKA